MASPENDLALTVRELSNVYEEISLLYRLSEVFSVLSIDEISLRIADEAVSSLGVKTAAVLFLEEGGERLYTKASVGDWDGTKGFPQDDGVFWKVIRAKKPSAFCRLAETEYRNALPQFCSLMVCPIIGKARVVGALVVADKESGEEFFSSDSKLLMAISSQAGLAIENALLYSELESLLIGAIRSLVKALEASSCWTAGHTERVTEYAVGIGRVMGLSDDVVEKLKISALLHDIGKIATPKEILNKKDSLDKDEIIEIRRHPELGAEILVELKQFKDIILSIKYHHEHWDGVNGVFGLKHEEIPIMARILAVADAFDAMTSDRPYRQMMSKEAAVEEVQRCAGTQFDPAVVSAFLVWVEGFTPRHRVFSP
ncbi:MAG: HD domain-containing protein [Nitrospiraceae bacterium]|nr:HD domain-containing protein [Nitrospiraceae bacterium]